jgi:hypothetical protein
MFLKADLGWLSGYPIGPAVNGRLPWRTTSQARHAPETELQLDGAVLHRATRTWGKVSRRYRRALPLVVGDAALWTERVETVLELLKEPIHGGSSAPDVLVAEHWPASALRAADQLQERWPVFAPSVQAMAWACFSTPDHFEASLAALRSLSVELGPALSATNTPRAMALRMAWLAECHGPEAVLPVVRMIRQLQEVQVPVAYLGRRAVESGSRFRRLIKGKQSHPTGPPRLNSGAELLDWTGVLSARPSADRARALLSFRVARPPAFPEPWAGWWRSLLALEGRQPGLEQGLLYRIEGSERRILETAIQLEALAPSAPRGFGIGDLLRLVDRTAGPGVSWHQAAAMAVARMPADPCPFTAGGLLARWTVVDEVPAKRVQAWLEAIGRWLKNQPPDPHPSWPWSGGLSSSFRTGHYRSLLDEAVLVELPRVDLAHVCTGLTALGACLEDPDEDDAVTLVALLRVGATPAHAVTLVELARLDRENMGWQRAEIVAKVYTLVGPFGPFAEVLEAFVRDLDAHRDLPLLQALVPKSALVRLIATGALRSLRMVASCVRALQAKGNSVPEWPDGSGDRSMDWTEFPQILRPALLSLEAWHATPEVAARRVLAKDLPDPVVLRRQIAALAARAASSRPALATALLGQRDRLEERLAHPQAVSPVRLAHLSEKLFHAACVAGRDRWSAEVEAAFRAVLLADLGQVAPWMGQPAFRKILPALLELPVSFRRLALEILRRRTGPAPWDFVEAPENQAFLKRMAEQGLDCAPWLGSDPLDGADDDLSLERDPLELFAMGAHFQTCLSPGGDNFFSVVANIVDINKQVLYQRRPDGGVCGRRLMTLTSVGGLMLFEAYHHDDAPDFPDRSLVLAESLAAQMGTVLVRTGAVESLVAPYWYDDGANSEAGVPEIFKQGSRFRRRLSRLPLDDLVPVLEAALRPLPINDLTLGGFLALPEVRARPELVLPLRMFLRRLPTQGQAWVLAVDALDRAGTPDTARELLRRHAGSALGVRQGGYLAPGVMEPLIRLDPSRVFRIIGRRERRDIPDGHSSREYWRGRALESLLRPHQAAEAYERCHEEDKICDCAIHVDARVRLQDLQRS